MKKLLNTVLATGFLVSAMLMTSPASAAYTWYCRVTEVYQNSQMISVLCENKWDEVAYFALDKRSSTAAEQTQFSSVATAALLAGKRLRVRGSGSTSNNPSGCPTGNCRVLTEWGIERD